MKRLPVISLYLSLLLALALGLQNCKKTEPDPVKPGSGTTTPGSGTTTPGSGTTIATTAPSFNTATAPTTSGITSASATVSAVLDGNGGAAISQHGFVYSKTAQTPTLADSKIELGATTGPFPLTLTSKLTGLDANTTYYVRAFATNDKGTSYGGVGQVKTTAVETPGSALAGWKTARSLGEGFDYTRTNDMIADASGNYYLAGVYNRAGKMGKFTLNPIGGIQDGFVVKLDPTGEPLWIVELKTTSSDEVLALDQDAAGNIYASLSAGTQAGTFGSVTLPAGYGRLAKITPQGSVEWVRSPGTTSSGMAFTNVDAQGNYYVTGRILGNDKATVGTTTLTGSDPAWVLNNGSEGWDQFIARFDRNGTLQWTRQISGAGQQNILFDVDPNGAVYMDVKSDKGPASVGSTVLSSAGEHIMKLSATGTIEWTKVIHTTGGTRYINELYCRSTGEFLVGSVSGAGLSLAGATTTSANPVVMAMYREDGTVKWATTTPGVYTDSRVLDDNGDLYITTYGNQNSSFRIGSITLPAQTGERTGYLVVAKFSPSQNKWLWAVRNGIGSNTQSANDARLAIAPSGTLMLTATVATGSFQFGATPVTMPLRFGTVVTTIEQK